MQLSSEVDVAIIGAGAAGLGAYCALADHGLSVIILEARDRIGGRALTRYLPEGIVFDAGCEWLHSADHNAFVQIASASHFDVADAGVHWGEQTYDINFPLSEQREFYAASEAFYARLELAAQIPDDSSAAVWLEQGNRWNPLIEAVSCYVNGSELSGVSVHDVESYFETGVNWRVRRGLQRSQDPGRDVARDAPCAPRHLHTFHGAHGRTGRAISSGASSEDRGLDGLAARLRGKGHARNK